MPSSYNGIKRYDPKRQRFKVTELHKKMVAAKPSDEHRLTPSNRVPGSSTIKNVIDSTSTSIIDAKSVFEVLPDTKLAMDILTSSIMSPNDLVSTDLVFKLKDNVADDKEHFGKMMDVIRKYFTTELNLSKLCIPALEDALFKTGSYPVVCVPKSSIDNIINGGTISLESLSESFDDNMEIYNLGILANVESDKVNRTKVSLENLTMVHDARTKAFDLPAVGVTVTDNPTILKKPSLLRRVAHEKARGILDSNLTGPVVSIEGMDEDNVPKIPLYAKRKFKNSPLIDLLTPNALGDDEPILYHPPSESVIPVSVPGDVTNKVGYFIALDGEGNPVSTSSSRRHWDRLKNYSKSTSSSEETSMRTLAERVMGTRPENRDLSTLKELRESYTATIERSLSRSVAEGVHGTDVNVELSEEATMLMLSRSFGRMKTQLLYVPAELMTYIAFDYNDLGVGRSLLESSKILSSMRAMLLLSNTKAAVKNSTPGVILNIELDPADKDPDATIEKVITLRDQAQRGQMPLGDLDLTNMAESLSKSNVQVSVSNHPMYPQTKVSTEDTSRSIAEVDTELEEGLRKKHLQSWGITPEMVDASVDTDFAANIILSNKLLVKRIGFYQADFMAHLTKMVVMFSKFSPSVTTLLIEELKNGKVAEVDMENELDTFFSGLQVGLPSPNNAKLESQVADLELYTQALDLALDSFISEEFIDGFIDSEIANGVEGARAGIRSYYLRNFMRSNNILTELDYGVSDDGAKRILEEHGDFIEGVIGNMSKFIRGVNKKGRTHDKKVEEDALREEEEETKKK